MSSDSLLDLYRDGAFARRMARGVVGEGAVEDVWQEAWREVLEKPPKAGWDVRGYVWTVARRMAGRARRGEGRRVKREQAVARSEALPSDVELLERVEVHRCLVAELAGLEEPYRRTLLLVFFEGLEAGEIARREGISIETVRTRRKRALLLMRERLRRKHGDQREWLSGLLALAGRDAEELVRDASPVVVVAGALALFTALLAGVVWWRGAEQGVALVPAPAGVPMVVEERPLEPATPLQERAALTPGAEGRPTPLPGFAPAPTWTLTGRVTDLAGQGLAEAQVTARLAGLFSVETLAHARCDADGRYELPLAALSPLEVRARFLALEAFAPGFRGETRELPLAELGTRVEAQFALAAGRTLAGLVLDERGAPVAKAFVRACAADAPADEPELLVTTDEHGRYRLGLAPGLALARVEAWHADVGWGGLAARTFVTALDTLVTAPPLVLAPQAVLRGRARHLDGSPARDLTLVAFLVEPDGRGGWREPLSDPARPGRERATAFSDDEGRFEFKGLCAGVFAYGAARHPPRVERGLAPGEIARPEEGAVELVLDLQRLLVEVVDAGGRALEDVAVTCTPLARAGEDLRPASAGLVTRTGGKRGRAAFSDLAPGPYALTASLPGWAEELEVELDGTTPEILRRIELGRQAQRGTLRLATHDGSKARFEVELATSATRRRLDRRWTSTADGLVTDLPAGTFQASLWRLDGEAWSAADVRLLTIVPDATLVLVPDDVPGGELELEFRSSVTAPAPVEPHPTGSAWLDLGTWASWQAERAHAVLIRPAQAGAPGDLLELEGATPAGGWRSPRPLAAGRYQLATRFPGHAPTTHSLVIEPGRVNTLVVPLDPAAPLR